MFELAAQADDGDDGVGQAGQVAGRLVAARKSRDTHREVLV